MEFADFGTIVLLVVIILGVQVQIVRVQKRLAKLEGEKK
jgi:hypothetical protein